ncbi:MAG: TonB-dependent receptor [Saprospiraceae bacterium]|nr:TonB-dependent receptor [Saprospiraceae bacterium]
MKKRLLIPLFLLFSWAIVAQVITVQGKITDAKTGEALVGASVVVKGTTNGTITDVEGQYSLDKVSPNAQLTFSYVGYLAQDVAVSSQRTLNIALEEETSTLKEVIVVGYGTQKKSDVTGAVASVKGKDIASIATPSVQQALQGKIAGVYVTPESGSPGAGAVIRIRGTGTLNNSNPFYVVDGLLSDDISFVNPNDVESVEVLKDASATAIYGSRGANGVIIVTTKRGKSGKPVIGLSSYYGSQELLKKIPLANATEYATLRNIAAKNFGAPQPYPNPAALGEGTDWQDEIFHTAPMQNVNLSARGGTDAMTYSISGDYFKQEGILQNGDFERLTLRINNEYKLSKAIKIGHNFSIINTKSHYAPGVIYNAYYAPPTVAPIDSAGKFGNTTSDGSVGNPVATRYYERYNDGSGFRTAGNFYLDLNLFKGLTYRSNFGLDLANNEAKRFVPVFRVTDLQKNDINSLSASRSKSINKLWENTMSYDNTFGKHHINLLAGVTAQIDDNWFLGGTGTNLPGDVNNIEGDIEDLLYLRAATQGFTVTESSSGWRMFSQLYRTNYSYSDKYLLTASMRIDKSSKFGKNKRTGIFPSIGLGWRVKEESFLKDVDWLSNLKLRGSWGITGNDKIDQNSKSPPVTDKLDAIFGNSEKFFPGATITRLSNPNLHWEETEQMDIGFEAGFLNNRLTTEIDWYKRTTYDILSSLPIPGFIGASDPPVVNSASVFNQGFDINLGWRDRTKQSLGYNVNVIVSTVHNEVISLGEGKTEIFSGGVGEGGKLGTRTVIGLPIGAYYGYKVDGVFQNTEELNKYPKRTGEQANKDVFAGDLRYADTNGDGVITDKDRTYLGSPIPDLTYTLNLGADYKGLDFSIQILGVKGNKVLNAKRLARFSTGNFEKTFLNGWTGEGTSNFEPRVTIGGRNYEVSERFIEDGAFTSIRNVQIGYTLPLSISRKLKMSNFRLYVSATNLKTWATYTGYTPEVVNGGDSFSVGIDRGAYPVAKTMTIGLNANF